MSEDLEVRELSQDQWEQAATNFSDYNYRQYWGYGRDSASRIGAASRCIGVFCNGDLIGLANVRLKNVPIFPVGIADINGGPLVWKRDAEIFPDANFERCLKALKKEFTEARNYVLRVRCQIYSADQNARNNAAFIGQGFHGTDTAPVYRTFIVDIDKTEEQIRKSLDGKWRNLLKHSEKNDLTVRAGAGDEMFTEFAVLFDALRKGKGFDVDLGVEFFQGVQQSLKEDEKFIVHIAEKDGEILAAHVGCYVGDTALYLLGASSHAGNMLKASYRLQWCAIQHAKKAGCKRYDLGGIDPEGNPGVFHFKKGFKGEDLTAAGPFEAGRPILVTLIGILESVYRRIKG